MWDTILAILDKIFIVVAANWSFLAVALLLGMIGEVIKPMIIGPNKKEAEKIRWKRVYIRTLPFHPVVAGGLLGLFLSTTLPELVASSGIVGSVLYFAAAGVISTWLYTTLKTLAPKITKAIQAKLSSIISDAGGKSDSDKSDNND
jgi:hypothetical protein